MSKLPIRIGQLLKGRHHLYRVVESLKSNTVFKATILPHPKLLPTTTQRFAVIKTEPDESMSFIYERERRNYELPRIASCSEIRGLLDIINHDAESHVSVEPRCMVFEWMDCDLRILPFDRLRSQSNLPRVVAKSVLEALAFFKRNYNAIHTDVNPNNIFLSAIDSPSPTVKVGHLGNMIVEGYDHKRIRSLPTRAAEVWRGLECWHTSDVWSLGVTLAYWLAQRFVFGHTDKIVEDNTEAWYIAKIIHLVGPIGPPVNDNFKDEFLMARTLASGSYVAPDTGEEKRFMTVGTIREELERIPGVSWELLDFVVHLLVIDYTKRPTA